MTFPISHAVSQRPRTELFLGDYLTGGDESGELELFVDKLGSDDNDGRSRMRPLRTVAKAMEIAGNTIGTTPSWATNAIRGAYVELGPAPREQAHVVDNSGGGLVVPANTTLRGRGGLRATWLQPQVATSDGFRLESRTYVSELSFFGWQLSPAASTLTTGTYGDSQTGFVFAFNPGASISTSPYIQNCTNASAGGGGMIVDGSVLASGTKLNSMVVDAYTQVGSGGIGAKVVNDGFVQFVSFFCNFKDFHVLAVDGGSCTLVNSNTSFGDVAFAAHGYRTITYPAGYVVIPGLRADGSITMLVGGQAVSFSAGEEIPRDAVVPSGGRTLRYPSRIIFDSHSMSWAGAGTLGADDNFADLPPGQGGTGPIGDPEKYAIATGGGVIYGQTSDETGDFRIIARNSDVATATQVLQDIRMRSEGYIDGENYRASVIAVALPMMIALRGE